MADAKISQLDPLGQAAFNDEFAIVDTSVGVTKRITFSDIMASPGDIGTGTPGSAEFTTLELSTGATVTEFSIDGTLAGDSDTAVPTEKSVKTYVDNAISSFSTNKIFEGDSYVLVNDATGGAGEVSIVVDGVEVGYYDALATSQRLGKVAGANVVTTDAKATIDIPSGNVFYADFAFVYMNQPYATSSTRLLMTPTNDGYVLLSAGGERIIEAWDDIQRFGGYNNGTYIGMNQPDNSINIFSNNQSRILVEETGTTIYDSLSINGDLFVDGTAFVVNKQEVTTADNLIVLNYGEVGPGVTKGYAGIEIDRGSSTDYQFLFEESSDTFRIGEIGDLQAVATREDSPISYRVPWWNDTDLRYDTTGSNYITIDNDTNKIQIGVDSGVVFYTDDFAFTYLQHTKAALLTRLMFSGTNDGYVLLSAGGERIVEAWDNVQRFGGYNNGTYIGMNQTAHTQTFYADTVLQTTIDTNGLTLSLGVSINEFSDDGTLAGDSDDAVPTEKAVKTYVDSKIIDQENVRRISSDTTAVALDIVLVDTTNGNVTIEMLDTENGRLAIKKISDDSNQLIITSSSGTIDGQAQFIITTQFQSYNFLVDNGEFFVI